MERRTLVSQKGKLTIAIVGLALVIIGNAFEYCILKIQIDQLIVNVGALLVVIGVLQSVFDEKMRDEIIRDISETTLGNEKMYTSGLVNVAVNSRAVEEKSLWSTSENLIIGVHYSSRFFEDFYEVLAARGAQKKETLLLLLQSDGVASKYLSDSESGRSDPEEKIRGLMSLVEELNSKYEGKVKVVKFDRVLRYTFIYTSQSAWITFFTNTKGFSAVPAIKVDAGKPLHEFFKNDINRLMGGDDE